ncbi:Presenilin-domain-containing protein [Globomyces pollinis-pini]|nr:Presenilin-domain-containing protein [Globomyces pollinis-pini]
MPTQEQSSRPTTNHQSNEENSLASSQNHRNLVCIVCSKKALFMCSLCSSVHYCSETCQQNHWPIHRDTCAGYQRPTTTSEHGSENQLDTIKYYVAELSKILKPVTLCMFTSILWVKLSNPPIDYFETGTPKDKVVSIGSSFGSEGGSSDSESIKFAVIIMAQIVVATTIIACLFKYGKQKIIYGLFGFVVFVLLSLFGYRLTATLLMIANFPMDWITLAFFLWNFVAGGLAIIFWKGPKTLMQCYLILMSSMMAFSLSQIPALVTWSLLGFLAVWDLIAVLCPYGPLRVMLESSQANGTQIPNALIYSAMIWIMATPGNPPTISVDNLDQSSSNDNRSPIFVARSGTDQTSSTAQLVPRPTVSAADSERRRLTNEFELADFSDPNAAQSVQSTDTDHDNGLKLGLGDFVFYSVLVGRASLSDWVTTVCSIIAVLSGLVITIFILVMTRKPLPALPISIFFGILIFIVSSITLTPMMGHLLTYTIQQAGTLRAGSQPSGFMYL